MSEERKNVLMSAVLEVKPKQQIQLYSKEFYTYCGIGGILSCGITHTLMTPVDLVKCRLQTGYPYKNTIHGLKTIWTQEGIRGISRGWAPTAVGYSFQGLCKFGFYEFFKHYYSELAGEENAVKYRTFIYIAGSASAEAIADVALCPWEAVKVRIQTDEKFARGLTDGLPKLVREQGVSGLYKGLVPLWLRQIPYTIMKFTAFESVVEMIYKTALSKPKEEYNKVQQLAVSFIGGYIAGVFCAVVSHPADVVVSKLNKVQDATIGQIVSELGFKSMWSGLLPRIFMIGTLTALQWFIYDSFKVYVGLPTTGAIRKPIAEEAIKEDTLKQ
jgi:solute carrier family 25 phosphate transporter 3